MQCKPHCFPLKIRMLGFLYENSDKSFKRLAIIPSIYSLYIDCGLL